MQRLCIDLFRCPVNMPVPLKKKKNKRKAMSDIIKQIEQRYQRRLSYRRHQFEELRQLNRRLQHQLDQQQYRLIAYPTHGMIIATGATGITDSIPPPQPGSYAQSTTSTGNQVQVATHIQAPATTIFPNLVNNDERHSIYSFQQQFESLVPESMRNHRLQSAYPTHGMIIATGATGITDSIPPPQPGSYAQSTTLTGNQVQVATHIQAPATTIFPNLVNNDERHSIYSFQQQFEGLVPESMRNHRLQSGITELDDAVRDAIDAMPGWNTNCN